MADLSFPFDGYGMTGDLFAREYRSLYPGGSDAALKAYRAAFAAPGAGAAGPLRAVARDESAGDAGLTVKFAFALSGGGLAETVSIPMRGGSRTVCVSSQIGCARSCAFCVTGKAGLARNLSAAEIVAQVVSASAETGERHRNVVFMGMGEPLDNFDSLALSLRVLADRRALAYSMERVTVCTCGVADRLAELGALGHKRLNVSISLNAARDELRDRLMPVNRRYPLEVLAAALRAYPRRRNFYFALNYCLLPGINDSPEDAAAVARFARESGPAIVNLIPYNPGAEPLCAAPTEGQTAAFAADLEAAGAGVKVREEKGRSAGAACGQLGAACRKLDGSNASDHS